MESMVTFCTGKSVNYLAPALSLLGLNTFFFLNMCIVF